MLSHKILHCIILVLLSLVAVAKDSDLYQILGVSRSADSKEIKTAYRRKARDTHPDKNKQVSPEEAAEAFRKVVHAFEILSDESSRRQYDRTGRAPTTTQQKQQQQTGNFYGFHWNFYGKPVRLKDKFEVQDAQSRVLHIVSLDQLKTVMLDDNDLLERNLLMCFVSPGAVETEADDKIVFPYPFAAMSSQGIWWEDLLQTVNVRYNKGNDLSRFFDLPSGDKLRDSGKPIFLFGKRGQPLSAGLARIQTSNRHEFEKWVWKQIEVEVYFENRHLQAVEIYWIHGSRAHLKVTLDPNQYVWHTSMLAHEWYARDARVDQFPGSPGRWKLSEESQLGSWKIGQNPPVGEDGTVRIEIEAKVCYDMSGHCGFWDKQQECQKNPNFMREKCPLTCKFCRNHSDGSDEL